MDVHLTTYAALRSPSEWLPGSCRNESDPWAQQNLEALLWREDSEADAGTRKDFEYGGCADPMH